MRITCFNISKNDTKKNWCVRTYQIDINNYSTNCKLLNYMDSIWILKKRSCLSVASLEGNYLLISIYFKTSFFP